MRKHAWLALVLSLAILFCACAKEEPAREKNENKETEPAAPVQQEMTQEQLDAAIYDTELQLIAAALETESQHSALNPSNGHRAVVADLDGDGRNELVATFHALIFEPDNRGKIGATYTQGGIHFFTDKDGNLYKQDGIGDFFTETVDGKELEFSGSLTTYHSYTDAPTIKTRNCGAYLEDKEILRQSVTIGSQAYSWEEGQKKLEEMGLTEITTTPGDYTAATYDTVYTDSLVAGLDSYFAEMYPYYDGKFTADIDGDGLDETGFLIPGLMDDWLAPYYASNNGEYDGMNTWLITSQFNYHEDHTGFLLVDPGEEQVTVRAVCSLGDLSGSGTMTYENHILTLGGAGCYLPVPGQEMDSYSKGLVTALENYGYSDVFMAQADLSPLPGKEILCFAMNGQVNIWEAFVFGMKDGLPVSIYQFFPDNTGCFISAFENQPALLLYTQKMNNFGDYQTSYSYRLLRFDPEGKETELDSHSVSYTKDQSDGTEAAAFFQKLEPYLQKLTVIYDPFKLTGQQWLRPEEADAGTPPEEPKSETPDGEKEPETEEATLGFVQVESEKSWLHLRVGPGTNYDKVLTNPDDPSSFVRQALGSPVTILETIETEDPENPVWVKIRITYQDTEIVGYSSKTYIRIP